MDLSVIFSRPYRVRFDEAGADGRARASTLVRYLQDLAWQHSEAAGFDRAWYAERGMGWLVRGLELTLLGGAHDGDTLTVTTRIAGWRRMWARRDSEVLAASGSPIARASIDWVLMDTSGRPMRIPAEMQTAVSRAEPFTPNRVDLEAPPADALRHSSLVRAVDVDPMGHLNNAAYVDLIDDALAAATGGRLGASATVRLVYLRPALPAMTLTGALWSTDHGLGYQLTGSDGPEDLLRAIIT